MTKFIPHIAEPVPELLEGLRVGRAAVSHAYTKFAEQRVGIFLGGSIGAVAREGHCECPHV
eukprot:10122606-Lingulodinium_polyedra.AAC.1